MSVKNLLRPIPGVKQLSRLQQQRSFNDSADYWERNYAAGGTSGDGSYGSLAHGKAEFLNTFVNNKSIQSVIEFGCGDGHQLSLAQYPNYVGLDVSKTAIGLCKNRFSGDRTKSFFLYEGSCFIDNAGIFAAEMAVSLDVVFHLIEDSVFERYMKHLFGSASTYVIVYSTNKETPKTAPHVRHRNFSSWVERNLTMWHLAEVAAGPNSGASRADFFVYERLATKNY